MNNSNSKVESTEALVCEALVNEIRLATRWKAVEEAWDALLHVRRMAKALKDEAPQSEGQGLQGTISHFTGYKMGG